MDLLLGLGRRQGWNPLFLDRLAFWDRRSYPCPWGKKAGYRRRKRCCFHSSLRVKHQEICTIHIYIHIWFILNFMLPILNSDENIRCMVYINVCVHIFISWLPMIPRLSDFTSLPISTWHDMCFGMRSLSVLVSFDFNWFLFLLSTSLAK